MRYIPVSLDESTYNTLLAKTVASFPTTNRDATSSAVAVTSIGYIAHPSNGSLEVKAATSGSQPYTQHVMFDRVQFAPNSSAISVNGLDGSNITIQPIQSTKAQVRVACSCLDFHYRFAVWNYNDGSLIGDKPPLYQRKTDRPPVNPTQTPGLCKHLIRVVDRLKTDGVVV